MLEVLFKNTSYNVNFLSGSMPNEDRQKTVDDFNSDPHQFVFLISTKAGGKLVTTALVFNAYMV